jgi:hypothetical protein
MRFCVGPAWFDYMLYQLAGGHCQPSGLGKRDQSLVVLRFPYLRTGHKISKERLCRERDFEFKPLPPAHITKPPFERGSSTTFRAFRSSHPLLPENPS